MKRPKTLMAAAVGTAPIMRPAWSWAQAPAEPNKYEWGQHMPYMMWDGSWYAMIFGPLFMILGLAVVIAVVVLLVRWLGGPWYGAQPPQHLPPARTPLDILKERFARGEIDKQEFEERRRLLGE
jgi:putative membrane protein